MDDLGKRGGKVTWGKERKASKATTHFLGPFLEQTVTLDVLFAGEVGMPWRVAREAPLVGTLGAINADCREQLRKLRIRLASCATLRRLELEIETIRQTFE